jgi:beta-1,4-mannosyl-glycoprotein beta-1,4-N-acetylglucosaminyltransferase
MDQIEKYLENLVQNPRDPLINFEIAYAYEKEGQGAAAVSYYLRCAEFTNNNTLASECLIRCSLSMDKQGGRDQKELHFIEQSITASPSSLEPYYIASLHFSWRGKWKKSYLFACLGINIYENNIQKEKFIKNVDFSVYDLYYQKAFTGSNIGKINESRQLYIKILQEFDIQDRSKENILKKLNELPEPNHPIVSYTNQTKDKLKYQFPNCEEINENFSQIYQDMFALSMNNGKKNGTYFEVGAGYPKKGNNTFLLETQFDWKGISVDIHPDCKELFDKNRKNECICADATSIDYIKLFSEHYKSASIDYLQLGCNPANITYDILQKIPFDTYKFGVITYEHDFYDDATGSYREKSRSFLKSKGYKLICGNISPLKDKYPFEDWWIHPDLIDENIWNLFERTDDVPINGEKYMLTKSKYIQEAIFEISNKLSTINNYHKNTPATFKLFKTCNVCDCIRCGYRWEEHQHDIIDKYLDEKSIAIEAGSHIGTLAVKLAKTCGFTYCFEPVINTYSLLEFNMNKNCISNKFKLFNKGLGESIKNENISWISHEGSGGIGITNNFYEPSSPEEYVTRVETIEIITIDSLNLDRLDYIKIDVEGYEEHVINGSIDTIKKYKPIIVLECYETFSPLKPASLEFVKDKYNFLINIGYEVQHIWKADFLLIPIEKNQVKDIITFGDAPINGEKYMLTKSKYIQNPIEEKAETILDNKYVAFWDNQLCERGTTTGLYNYAYYNEKILGNKSYIFYEKNNPNNNNEIIEKFKQKFEVFPVENFKEVDSILLQNQITHIFIIKSGQTDDKISKVSKNCIQCVFDCNEPHGEIFCSISIDVYGNDGKYPVIPRIITLPEHNLNMRQQLNIPQNAIVFGGYGGKAQFDIHYVQEVVYEIAKNNKNIYFLFANFNRFCQDLHNIIHLPCIIEEDEKVRFINSCDAMLWARSDGETFGQAIAEFSIRNKPVIATKVGALSHVAYLGNKGIWYNDEKNLTEILLNFNPEIESKKDWNAYKDYTPERVMKIFDDVFLKNNITQAEYKFYDFIEIGTSDLLFPLSQEEKHKIQSVNGLMTAKQYELIYKIIKQKSSCNVLVFGLGEDSYLWKSANKEGKTIFIENIKSWADRFSDLDIEIVNYKTTVLDYPNNLNEKKLLLDLPEYIKNIKWDIIIIDSPVGHNPPCIEGQCKLCSPTNPAPGRMSSIFTASKLVHKNSIIIIDDINREIEYKCTKMYIQNKFNIQYNDEKLMILYNKYEKGMKIFDDIFLKDDKISKTINCNKKNYTFCTFWFDIGDKNITDVKNSVRSCETYLNSLKKVVNKCDNLYVWCDNKMYEDIKHIQTDNIIIKQKNITELPLYKKKTEIIESLNEMYKNKKQNTFSYLFKNHKNIEAIANYLIIVNSKFYMIKTIKDINIFNSQLFSWIDFGIFQHDFKLNNYNKLIPNYTETLNIVCNVGDGETTLDIEDKLYIYGNQKTEFACTLFTINLKFIDNLYKNYYKYIDSMLLKKLISTEQSILTLYCSDYNLFNTIDIHHGSYNSLYKLIKPFTVGLAILSHNRPAVLNQTLKSYKEKKFFDFFDEKIILLQENLPETRNVAEKYELEIYSTEENIGIGLGNNYLIDKLNTDYFIICQDDFVLIEDNFRSQILESISLIEKNIINCARMRNICNPGEPCYGSNRLPFPEGNLPLTHISDILYKNYIIYPEKKYGEIFKKYNENTYIISSKYANYTENPCVYKREWYKNNLYELNKVDGKKAENNIQNIWEKNEYMIGMGRGIFSHNDKIYSPKIIDCFIFYNELDLLNYRLNLLDDYVDYFVLVEAIHTFTGKEKKLFYNENKELFEKFKDKIIHVIVDDFPYKYPDIDIEKNEQWKNEIYQRNSIKRGIDKLTLHDNDLVVITDLDEIPNPEILNKIKENKKQITISSLKMDMYYYNLNCKTKINDWISPKIISYKEFTKLDITIHDFRYKKTDNIIENGGWHLSFFGDKEFIANKIENYGHQEFNNDEILKNIEEKIKSKKDLFNRENHEIQYIDIEDNENLPPKYDIYLQKYFSLYIKENTNLIKDFYDFIPCHDQKGNDIYKVNKENLKMTLQNASNDPSIVAINTEGYVKNKIEKLEQINGWYWNIKANKSDGIYIKKTINDTLVKCSKSSIPVLGTLVCTTTKWIKKQLDSIDFPIENYIIINNNTPLLAKELDEIVSNGHKFIKNLKVYHMPYNLGCAEGWNTIIKSFIFSPYWVIINDDVSFTPGFLKELHETALENPDAGMVHGKPIHLPNMNKFGSFDMFLIRDWVIKDYGLFDINYYPAYLEDFDYMLRLWNKPIRIINELKHKYYHGDTLDYNVSGKNTQKTSDELFIRLINARYKNYNYFLKKWNANPENINENNINDIYKYPFNNPENNISLTTFDINFAREKDLLNSLPKKIISNKEITLKIEEKAEIIEHISFPRPNVIVIDNFYKNVDEIREYALSQTYQSPEHHGAVGYRCENGKKIMDGTKEMFERLLGGTIPNGSQHGEWGYSTNGCFQWCNTRVPIVYHCDSQKYAGIIYLTPNAPPNCGTSFFRHKNYKIRNSSIFSKSDWYKSDLNHKEPHLDKTQWEIVDSVGNVYNRLVIFDAQYIHAVTEYFGEDINNSRLFQLFFFNIN